MSNSGLRRALGAVALLLMAVVTVGYSTDQMSLAGEDLGEMAAALLAAANCALACRAASGQLRWAWGALASACGSWAIGELIWSIYEVGLGAETPFPSAADIGYLGFPLGALAALAVFPSRASGADRRRMTLDGLMASASIGLISWATSLGAVVTAGGDSTLAAAVSVAYPLSDIALLVVCALVLSRSQTHRLPLGLIASGLALMAVSDSGFAYLTATNDYQTGSPIDLGWFLAFGLLALAPVSSSATRLERRPVEESVGGTALPYVPLTAAAAFLTWRYIGGETLDRVETVLAVVLVLLVLLRQFLTLRDNQQLATTLAERDAELRHQAFHDGLTGLANRALYVDRVTHALELHRRDRRPLAICFLDLDGFKVVNDTRGHSAGDELLRQAGQRFRGALSDADTLARFGGDEFAVLLESCPEPMLVAQALLASLSEPFLVAGHTATVLASIGVAVVTSEDPTPSVDDLLTRADVAMYVVKRRGKADVLLHTAGMQLEEVDDVTLGRSLAEAIDAHQIRLAYQPIIELAEGRLHTLEALVRWRPDDLPVPAQVVVRVAERCNLMGQLFRVVLAEACTQLERWSTLPGGADVRVAINLSPSQLASAELPRWVVEELSSHGLTGDRLVLEITETEGLAEADISLAVCHELRRLGVRLSVDDFGVGLSSLARLRDLPIDEVKIDRSFVAGVDQDGGSRRFVRGVIAFADEIGLRVVAEGVEREAERAALAELGCQYAQGFLFSPPVTAQQVDALLADGWQRDSAAVVLT